MLKAYLAFALFSMHQLTLFRTRSAGVIFGFLLEPYYRKTNII